MAITNDVALKKQAETDRDDALKYVVGTGVSGGFFGALFLIKVYTLYEASLWPTFMSLTTIFFVISLVLLLVMGLVFLPDYNKKNEEVDRLQKQIDQSVEKTLA